MPYKAKKSPAFVDAINQSPVRGHGDYNDSGEKFCNPVPEKWARLGIREKPKRDFPHPSAFSGAETACSVGANDGEIAAIIRLTCWWRVGKDRRTRQGIFVHTPCG
jgi:hypothetical protein